MPFLSQAISFLQQKLNYVPSSCGILHLQTVKSVSVCANFLDRPISLQVFQPVCALPVQFSKKGLQILLLPRTERWFQYNPCSFALGLDDLLKLGQE